MRPGTIPRPDKDVINRLGQVRDRLERAYFSVDKQSGLVRHKIEILKVIIESNTGVSFFELENEISKLGWYDRFDMWTAFKAIARAIENNQKNDYDSL